MGANYFQNNDLVSDDTPFGLYFGSDLSSAYGIFRESGGWGFPFPDLRIAFHTGIKMGANAGYGGMKFYTDYGMDTQVMSINNGADPLGGSNVYVNNSLQAGSSLRAPIFYNTPDTAYYLDPDSTSRLFYANVNFLSLLNEEGLNVKGIRGQFAAGSDGCGISLFSNVDIGYPSGWGSGLGNTPSRGLSVYGGLRVAYSGGGFITCDTSVRAPIFYDIPDTGFYVDPSSTSNISGLTVGNRITGSISGDAQRLFNHTGANNDGLQYWNTVGNSTLNPNDGWHYAIRMGHGDADTYYSATIAVDFFNDNVWLRRKGGGANQPWKRFALYDNAYEAIFYASSFSDANNTAFFLDPNNTGTSLNVAGSIVAAGNVTAYSDIRVKANVETIPSALDKLDQIRGVTYTRTDLDDKEQRYAGVIAQEIEKVLPEAVRDLGNIKAVDYNATIGLLIQAVKELRDEVEAMKSRLH
jgi:hypothetical protein